MPVLTIPDIYARRSIRRYTAEDVSESDVRWLLEAAMAAPSANNGQPWHFVVVRDETTRQNLAACHPYAKMLPRAPVCIVPCADPMADGSYNDYWVQDLAAATENLLLAATALGLGAVWCGVYPREGRMKDARTTLAVPQQVMPFAFIAIGHPAETRAPRTQYSDQRVHKGKW